jgi:Transposase, Mutator family
MTTCTTPTVLPPAPPVPRRFIEGNPAIAKPSTVTTMAWHASSQDTVDVVQRRIDAFAKQYGKAHPDAVRCLLADRQQLTTYLPLPREHWSRIRHSHFNERTSGETRRRTKVIPGEPARIRPMAGLGAARVSVSARSTALCVRGVLQTADRDEYTGDGRTAPGRAFSSSAEPGRNHIDRRRIVA